jgi:hypothetical protein
VEQDSPRPFLSGRGGAARRNGIGMDPQRGRTLQAIHILSDTYDFLHGGLLLASDFSTTLDTSVSKTHLSPAVKRRSRQEIVKAHGPNTQGFVPPICGECPQQRLLPVGYARQWQKEMSAYQPRIVSISAAAGGDILGKPRGDASLRPYQRSSFAAA